MRMPVQKRSSTQNGSLIKANRRNGQEVWEFRWRDRTSGKAVYRRIALGSAQQFPTEIEARAAAAGIVLEINVNDPRVQTHALTPYDVVTWRPLAASQLKRLSYPQTVRVPQRCQ
jgi:hypothetical protein